MAKKKKARAKRKPAKRRAVKRRKPARRKPVKRRPAAKKRARKPRPKAKKAEGKVLGVVTHYFPKVRAAVVKLKDSMSIGDIIKIKGHTTDFRQTVTSLQINRVPVNSAKKGAEIGLLSNFRVRHGDTVYKI